MSAHEIADISFSPSSEEPAHLFSPLTRRGLTLPNRVVVSPMCQYSSEDGFATDWHLVHLGSRAVGGAGLVFTEAAAVEARGRISPQDLGIYRDEHVAMLRRITDFITGQGSVPGIQLAHAGRKASTRRPWDSGPPTVTPKNGGWIPVAPSAIPFSPDFPQPVELTREQIGEIVTAFALAARRALRAGFQVAELHAAHGYLFHQFLSPISNHRTDEYGGSEEDRQRLLIETADAVRREWPAELPLFVRVSATDWLEDSDEPSWQLPDTIRLAAVLREHGVDVIDVSSGGMSPHARLTPGPGYQVPFAEAIRHQAGIRTMAVGLITEPEQADDIVRAGQADLVALARAELRDPYWPRHAAHILGASQPWPPQYLRAKA